MCMKVSSSYNGKKSVGKSCTPRCSSMKYSTNINGVETEFNCCEGNLCNGTDTVLKKKYTFYIVSIFVILKIITLM